jgi:hypothetical protein
MAGYLAATSLVERSERLGSADSAALDIRKDHTYIDTAPEHDDACVNSV